MYYLIVYHILKNIILRHMHFDNFSSKQDYHIFEFSYEAPNGFNTHTKTLFWFFQHILKLTLFSRLSDK